MASQLKEQFGASAPRAIAAMIRAVHAGFPHDAFLRDVLSGTDGGHRSAVILNAAGGIAAAGHAENLQEGIERARESIDSGAAAARLDELVSFSQQVPA